MSQPRRRLELDALRGLMLAWMTFTHLPTVASAFCNQTLGFVSSSEGFVFLSALFTGRVYTRLAQREGDRVMARELGKRALRLYGYHLFLVGFAFELVTPLASSQERPNLHNLLSFYFTAGAKQAYLDAALLLYRPALLDILPLYVTFVALSVAVLFLARRLNFGWILAGAFAVWILSQFGLRRSLYEFLHLHAGLGIPYSDLGAFDPWAWQLLWVVGLGCGMKWARGTWPTAAVARRHVVIAAASVGSILLVLRWMLGAGASLGHLSVLVDKWHLGALRLVDLASLAVLAISFQRALAPLAVKPLVALGQASIQVFCAHVLLCFAGLAVLGTRARMSLVGQAVLLILALITLHLTARLFAKRAAPVARKAEGIARVEFLEEPEEKRRESAALLDEIGVMPERHEPLAANPLQPRPAAGE